MPRCLVPETSIAVYFVGNGRFYTPFRMRYNSALNNDNCHCHFVYLSMTYTALDGAIMRGQDLES